jgi:hypothetical protein
MKKIFTLFFAFSMIAVAQAQSVSRHPMPPIPQQDHGTGYDRGSDNGRDVAYNDYGKGNRYDDRVSIERKKNMEIARINREYDIKVQRVRNGFFLFRFEKDRQIRILEQQRQQEIRMVMARYNNDRRDGRGYNDRDNSRNHY